MLTAIIDYESGNLHSAHKAFERMAREVDAGDVIVTADAEVVSHADRIVLPGDGAFPACMMALKGSGGLYDAMVEAVEVKGRPFLGICVGMQLMASIGREYEDTVGLGWIKGEVTKITPSDPALKVPHMGWNDLVIDHPHPVFADLKTGDHAYFVHSYHMVVDNPAERLAHVDYAGDVTAIIGRDTMLGMQFHPEKSQATGLQLIANFLKWAP
jgi:glutamine amidotransferase